MSGFWSFLYGRKVTISETASLCGRVFDSDDGGMAFFDSVLTNLLQFDEFNERQQKIFPNDVNHIIQCTITDLTNKNHRDRSIKRLDAYLYIYSRVQEYNKWTNIDYKLLQEMKQNMFQLLVIEFASTKGRQPNLLVEDKDQLLLMNIPQHLSSIVAIDKLNAHKFFALSKLSMQAVQFINDNYYRFQWIDILSNVKTIGITLKQFIDVYLNYQEAFKEFPFDTSVLIHLIQRMHPAKEAKDSPFKLFLQLNKSLKLDTMLFLERFQSIFTSRVKYNWYRMEDIAELFTCFKSDDQLCGQYFAQYSSNASTDDVWNMFLHLYKIGAISNVIQKHLIPILNERILSTSIVNFQRYARLAKNRLADIKPELQSHFIRLFENIFDAYIIKQIGNSNCWYQLSRTEWIDILQVGLEISSTDLSGRRSCLLLLRKIVFEIESLTTLNAQRLKDLFRNLKIFNETICQKYDPQQIIEDDWLKDFLIANLQIWLKLDQDTYKYISENHENNPWAIYIWSRIVHLSLSKMFNSSHIDILTNMDDWMKKVECDIYKPTDIFTMILMNQLFQLIIVKYSKSILSLPNVVTIMNFIISMRENTSERIATSEINKFINNCLDTVHEIFQLKSKCSLYRDLLTDSIIRRFIPLVDLNSVFRTVDRQQYRFPLTRANIDDIVALQKPNDIDITNIESKEEFFSGFIRQINEWSVWFDRFVDIFQHIIDWLKNHNVNRSNELLIDMLKIREDPKMTFMEMRTIIDRAVKILHPFKDLRRLCHLFNCLISFQILNPGSLSIEDNTLGFLTELKRFQPNNTFTVEAKMSYEQIVSVSDRQQTQWSLASENYPCDITVEYRIHGTSNQYEILYQKQNVSIHKNVLRGQFESQRNGQLFITVDNKHTPTPRVIWYRIKSIGLSTCHLFHGIFNMHFNKYYKENSQSISEIDFSKLLDTVFIFINKLLNGDISLRDMTELQTIFKDKNINIREEVKKLFINRSNEQNNMPTTMTQVTNIQPSEKDIEQVCDWLQIYQYYSHLNVIMECIEKFDLLPLDNEEAKIGHLKRLSGNENCSLREITQAYSILQECFQNLTHQHLQLIKTAVECFNVIEMMKKSDLYSTNGQRRFQELRDNLTTQFQLQEFNNMILNSWIMTYSLIEPFTFKAKSFDDFILRIGQISNLEESSLNHIKVINDNIQIVTMWLSAEETTVLDNALITMEHLYKSGSFRVYLRHLTRKPSYYEVGYVIERIQGGIKKAPGDDDKQEVNDEIIQAKKIQFLLSMSDIDDHKRQLTFCNVDVQQNLIYKKALINGQLKLLQTVENIYHILTKLELAGHPDYQLRDESYDIRLQQIQTGSMLNDLRSHQNARLDNAIQVRIQNLDSLYDTMKATHDRWIQNLEKYRQDCPLLKLFSNREIMILIILLQKSNSPTSTRNRLLKNLFSFKDLNNQNEEEDKLAVHCLQHYLYSLRISEENLTMNRLTQFYQTYRIEARSNSDTCLKKLSEFLGNIFEHDGKIFQQQQIPEENRQYLVSMSRTTSNSNQHCVSNDFDLNTSCVLLNIFQNQLPSAYQILWCPNATQDDIHLFFSRIRTFPSRNFAIMDIDKMHHRLREILLNEQDLLTHEQEIHGKVFYFSREITTARKGLRLYPIPESYKDSSQSYQHLLNLFKQYQIVPSKIQIINGAAGIGKTHRINTEYKSDNTSCFSINDKLNLSLLISSFLLFDSQTVNNSPSIFFNISIHAPFEILNRTLFSLFICGCLNDPASGLIFSLPHTQLWKFIIEVPYTNISGLDVRENFYQILPILSVVSPSTLEEVTDDNYKLSIKAEEEVVARFLKAFENRTIDRMVEVKRDGNDIAVSFDQLTDVDECRTYIYNCIRKYAPDLPRNKIYELSFTKFLYRRARFFVGPYYCWNQSIQRLGSIAMEQMINEANYLTQINFRNNSYPRVYLVYDPGFSLHLLHGDWNHVSSDLKSLFNNKDPLQSVEYKNKDYYAECLAWLIDIKYETFMKVIHETKFILTENFAYKLFHVHERKLTKLALIIEGDTGVGKTFLLKFYSLLLNSKTTSDPLQKSIIPKISENSHEFLLKIIETMIEKEANILNGFLQSIRPKILGLEKDEENEVELLSQRTMQIQNLPATTQNDGPIDNVLLADIKQSLKNYQLKKTILYHIWKTILTVSTRSGTASIANLIESLHDFVTNQLVSYPLIGSSTRLKDLLQEVESPSAESSIEIFKEYLFNSQIKPLFYRLLLHPGITEEQLVDFMAPISQLARELPEIEIVVFFDEVNTASCLGLFKEMFMDGTLHGTSLPKNIFFTAAINPAMKIDENTKQIHRSDYIVHDLPQSLKDLKVSYGALESRTLADYIIRKISMFQVTSSATVDKKMPLESYVQDTLADSILKAQEFCEKYLGHNSVSQREIQRCFSLIDFFWTLRYDEELKYDRKTFSPNPIRCIALSIALIYYFRLPTQEDNLQRKDEQTPSREQLSELLCQVIPAFDQVVQHELEVFVNTDNFVIPQGVAINQAVREHIFSIVVSIVTRTPLCIIGVPGQSKTLSFQIVLQNLQGPQLSTKPFCKRLPALDPFFCLGSKYSRSEDIAFIFDRAIKREQQYEQNRMNTRCVVFLDEASLPDEKKMVLKVLHPYLDECKVAFVAVANKAFDAANANRMICIYRSLPSQHDQRILAYGCLGLQSELQESTIDDRLEIIISGLCQGYRRMLQSPDIPHIFHDRDFIYMLRELRFELMNSNEIEKTSIGEITPRSLLRALEDNFHGVRPDEFNKLVDIFAASVGEQCPDFLRLITQKQQTQRNIPEILRNSMKLDPTRRRLYGRYKLIIDESEDESAVRLLFQLGILDSDPNRTTVFRMPDFPDDVDNELRNVEILSNIKLCMETGKTILMINTGRIHGSLYDVFNQNFSIMATEESRKIFSKVAIGPKTIDVVVHEEFQCIVHIKRSEFKDIPAPFLSRFQKYSFGIADLYSIQLKELPEDDQKDMNDIQIKARSFVNHFGREYLYGFNDGTLYSCLLSFIKRNDQGTSYLSNIHENYNQLTLQSKPFIELDLTNKKQCYLYFVLSKILQLASPESIILKLPTFDNSIDRSLCQNYFYQQEHFNIENFLDRFISNSTLVTDNNELFTMNETTEKKNNIVITRKLMVFTRTSSFVIGLNNQSKDNLFGRNDRIDMGMSISEKIDIINLAIIENSNTLNEHFQNFKDNAQKSILIIIIDGRISHQRVHIPFVRQIIDKIDLSHNQSSENKAKFFIILMHSSEQELNYKSCFPSIFLHDWDYWFLDTSTPGSAFHLQKMLQIFTSKIGITHQKETLDNSLYDLNMLFDECLWEFCSRLQINLHKVPDDMFNNPDVCEFYQRQTTTRRRVECLKNIFQRVNGLQKYIIISYHENVSMKEESLRKNCNSIYDLAKDTLCGKHTSLVDSLQSHIRISFTNFVSYILKYIIDDYGLESLTKLSSHDNNYGKLLELLDYSSFTVNYENKTGPNIQGILTLNDHYSCIPQTPLFHLCQQRIKILADNAKIKLAQQQDQTNDRHDILRFDYYDPQPVPAAVTTTAFNDFYEDDKETDNKRNQFRTQLIRSITNDKILNKIISSSIVESYTRDSIRILCTIIEKNFHDKQMKCEQTIDFISRWLILIDHDENVSYNSSPNHDVWRLAHVYTLLEYEQDDLLALYSACRITENLDTNQTLYEDLLGDRKATRSNVRENLFQLMFHHLWTNLCRLCQDNLDAKKWIYNYTLISKYYPSERVLQRLEFVQMKIKIEFMNLAYLILLNQKTPQPTKLIQQLLHDTSLAEDDIDGRHIHFEGSSCLQLLSTIISVIDRYFEENNGNNGTLMMDIQQWIISTIKTSKGSSQQEIIFLLKFLNQSSCHLSLSMKQLLFDDLATILTENSRQNRMNAHRQFTDFWDRISLLSVIVECLTDENLENYQIPYHPSVITNVNQNHMIIDLFFFHLRRLVNDEKIQTELINKILLSSLPKINNTQRISIAEKVYKQLKEYFLLQTTALLLCQVDLNTQDQQRINSILMTVINQYLTIATPVVQLSRCIEHFFSIIITKRSWHFLLGVLKSDRIQRLNAEWANTLHKLFEMKQNKYLHFSDQLQFTLTTDSTSSIFPTLHRPYDELNILVKQCITDNNVEQRWIPLTSWIQLKLSSNPPIVSAVEIKVMLLLNIYYNYYCNAQLNLLGNLLTIIENTLQLSDEEKLVFRVFLNPEENMIGYPKEDNTQHGNYLNDLFKIDCQDEEQLPIRHTLVNLLAMILLGGKQNTLWTFTFEPLKLENTYGFASTSDKPISRSYIHYDCGCVLSETGELVQRHGRNEFSIPAVYIAFFATFGAMAWHLLLFESSVANLNGPILSPGQINLTATTEHIAADNVRAKVCFFVCTRLLSTNLFLKLLSNQDDASLLFNRCFELFAQYSRRPDENPWIKPVYQTNIEKLDAEDKFRSKIFSPTNDNLFDYKKIINNVQSQSEIQTRLHDYIAQMPVIIQFIHFRTEFCNSESSRLPIKILRRLLDSFEILKITHYIYALSQFHILLHRTFTQLIERDEFHKITLQQLYERADQSSSNLGQANQKVKYQAIIENGIKAVNDYHTFADGLIQPGACDMTQRFESISQATPVSYLVETDNVDEGDIIMRILSVLVNYHNHLLQMLESEINEHGDALGLGPLKDIINEFLQKEISILQISTANMGVITLNKIACQWIERLSRASLENENDYFLKMNSPLKFNFLYVQSYLIRTYLLYCRINYQHIKGKYQCYIKRKISMTTIDDEFVDGDNNNTDAERLSIDEWNHLDEKNLDQLQNELNFLQRIIDVIKNSEENHSSMKLSEFVRNTNYDDRFAQQLEQYRIKDFSLSQIKNVYQLYEKSMNQFQHAYINISHLLRILLDKKLSDQLDEKLTETFIASDNQNNKEELQNNIQTITAFLNDLKAIEDMLAGQWAQSFVETCECLSIENSITKLIPKEIKCENYVPLCMKLIEMRTRLQERTIDIEEKTVELWNSRFDVQDTDLSNNNNNNNFQAFRQAFQNQDDELLIITPNPTGDLPINSVNVMDEIDKITASFDTSEKPTEPLTNDPGETISYDTLFKFEIRPISLSPSVLFETSRTQANELASRESSKRFDVIFKEGKPEKHFCKPEKFYEKLGKIIESKKYDFSTTAIITPDHVSIDFRTKNENKPLPIIEAEYRVVDKSLLIPIILEYENKDFNYFALAEATIVTILSHFIVDQQLQFTSENYFSVFDFIGRCMAEDCQIDQIYRSEKQTETHVRVLRSAQNVNICREVIVTKSKDETRSQYFNSIATLKQIDLWTQIIGINVIEHPIQNYIYWHTEKQNIIDDNQTISSTLGQAESVIIDVISRENFIDVILSYDKTNTAICILKSSPVRNLLNVPTYAKQLGLEKLPENSSLVLILNEKEKKILNNLDMENSISYFALKTSQTIHFEISILIEITRYDNETETTQIPISHRNITIKRLLEMIKINDSHTYLASNETKIILSELTSLSDINETKFVLVKEHQTCLLSIKQPSDALVAIDDNTVNNQRYIINAVVDDVYKQNKTIGQSQYLLYDNDIVPSRETLLSLLLDIKTSSIEFNLSYEKLPVNVTVTSDEHNSSIEFQCQPSMSTGRIYQIVCRLWKLKSQLFSLTLDDDAKVDDDYELKDIDESINDFKFKLISIADVKCTITYQNDVIILSTTDDTVLSTIMKEVLEKFLIPIDDIDLYEFHFMDDSDEPIHIALDDTIIDIRSLLLNGLNIIPMQLYKKPDVII
ncbi:unnamed protein product [Rotaria magnacalcarata]